MTTAATVSLPYTCGELVQGRLEGSDFHITCPVARRGRVTAAWSGEGTAGAARLPPKTHAMVRRTMVAAGSQAGAARIRITLGGRAPHGKGLAASSVDVLGAGLALRRLLGAAEGAAEANRLALLVEPTDGIALPGIALFDHRRGTLAATLGAALPLGIVVLEPPETVATGSFHRRRDDAIAAGDARLWRDAVAMVRQGLAERDARGVARAATLSAEHWQRVLPNAWLAPALAWGGRQGALGLCRAHSGTVLGLLFADEERAEHAAAGLRRLAHGKAEVWTTRLDNGGAR